MLAGKTRFAVLILFYSYITSFAKAEVVLDSDTPGRPVGPADFLQALEECWPLGVFLWKCRGHFSRPGAVWEPLGKL